MPRIQTVLRAAMMHDLFGDKATRSNGAAPAKRKVARVAATLRKLGARKPAPAAGKKPQRKAA